MKKENEKKKVILMIVGIIALMLVIVGATFAYFNAQVGKGDSAQINAQTGTADSLTFNISDIDVTDSDNKILDENNNEDANIVINATQSNFAQNGNSLGDGVKLNAHLIAGDDDSTASFTYNLYLDISQNNLEYTSYQKEEKVVSFKNKEKKEEAINNEMEDGSNLDEYEVIPELVLVVQKPDGEYLNEIKGLNKSEITIEGKSVPCFDITEAKDLITITSDYLIDATTETKGEADQNWQVRVIFKNLETDQHLNTNKSFQANLSIQSENLNYLDLASYANCDKYGDCTYTDYRSDDYNSQIKNVYFVDRLAEEDELNSVAKWDLSSSKDGSIIGWLKANEVESTPYDLYIGSNLEEEEEEEEEKIKVRSFAHAFENLENVETIDLNPSILDTTNLNDTSYMFNMTHDNYSKLKTIEGIEDLDVSNVENMSYMFFGDDDMTALDISNWNTHNVTDMSHMFEGMISLTEITGIEDLDVSNVIDMSYMFAPLNLGGGAQYRSIFYLNELDLSNWKVEKVKNMSSMFEGLKLTELNISGWNTHNVINMSYMFGGRKGVFNIAQPGINNLIGIEDLDVSNVKDMSGMFSFMENLTTLNLSNWRVDNVENMSEMFQGINITELNISGWKTSKVTDMSNMFGGIYYEGIYEFSSFDNIIGIKDLDVSNVEDMSGMFTLMESPTTLDLSNWNTQNVINMTSMFSGSSNLTSIDMRKATFSQVTSYGNMFYDTNSELKVTITGEDNKQRLLDNTDLTEDQLDVLPE